MKITIDTKEDSHEEIKKVISMLSKMVEDVPVSNSNIFGAPSSASEPSSNEESAEPVATNAFANMFGSTDSGNNNMGDGTPVLEPNSSESSDDEKEDEDSEMQIIEY